MNNSNSFYPHLNLFFIEISETEMLHRQRPRLSLPAHGLLDLCDMETILRCPTLIYSRPEDRRIKTSAS